MGKRSLYSFIAVFIIGTILGTLGTLSYPINSNITNFWPAAAVQTVAGVLFGWWGFAAAILFPILTNFLTDGSTIHALGFIPSSIIQTGIPMLLVKYSGIHRGLKTTKDMLLFVFFGAVVPHALGALWGTVILRIFNPAQNMAMSIRIFCTWLIGNIPSAVIFGTFILKILVPIMTDDSNLQRLNKTGS